MSDLYTIVFLIPDTGNRVVIDGVSAEVERTNDFRDIIEPSGLKKRISTGISHLEFKLEMATIPSNQYQKLAKEILHKDLYLYFKDAHPNLIKGMIKNVTVDSHLTTINFSGNVTDKEYIDYVTEITTQINAQIIYWNDPNEEETNEPNDPIDNGIVSPMADSGFKKKVHFNKQKERKDKVPKRKLTF